LKGGFSRQELPPKYGICVTSIEPELLTGSLMDTITDEMYWVNYQIAENDYARRQDITESVLCSNATEYEHK
jgi:hypothetical protein